MVDCWQCQAAVTPILNRVWHPLIIFADWMPADIKRFGVS